MMLHPYDFAVAALEQTGSVEFTHDGNGHTVYMGHVVSVPHIIQKAEQKGMVITSQRTVIDNGSFSFVVSRKQT